MAVSAPTLLSLPPPPLANNCNYKVHCLPAATATLSSAASLRRPVLLPELRSVPRNGDDVGKQKPGLLDQAGLPPVAFPKLPDSGYVPLLKRCDIAANVFKRFGWADSKPTKKPLEQVLRQMRKPSEEQDGLQKAPWLASVERLRGAEQRRRGGVDDRPVPSWNFRYGAGIVGPPELQRSTSRTRLSTGTAAVLERLDDPVATVAVSSQRCKAGKSGPQAHVHSASKSARKASSNSIADLQAARIAAVMAVREVTLKVMCSLGLPVETSEVLA